VWAVVFLRLVGMHRLKMSSPQIPQPASLAPYPPVPALSCFWSHGSAAVASDPEPVLPGLSPDDTLTLYFTKPTNRPHVSSTAAVETFLALSPPLASVYRATWQAGGDSAHPTAAERLVISLLGVVNADISATLVPSVRINILPTVNLQDANETSQGANIVDLGLSGTWGDASQPMFLVSQGVTALNLGGQVGLGQGDALLLRFNQPVAQVPVGNKTAVDALLVFDPPFWALDYRGAWLDYTTLVVYAGVVSGLVPSGAGSAGNGTSPSSGTFAALTSVGALTVTVLPTGGLTSFDGTSSACNDTSRLSAGSWGDVVCESAVMVYSHTALAVTFKPPLTYAPGNFTIEVSGSPLFPVGPLTRSLGVTPAQSDPSLARAFNSTSLWFTVRALTTRMPYWVRVAAASPALPAEVAALVPARPLVYKYLRVWNGFMECPCGLDGCVAGTPEPVVPLPPIIGEFVGKTCTDL
jgi:hypothetical protein